MQPETFKIETMVVAPLPVTLLILIEKHILKVKREPKSKLEEEKYLNIVWW